MKFLVGLFFMMFGISVFAVDATSDLVEPSISDAIALLPKLWALLHSGRWVAATATILIIAIYAAKYFGLFEKIHPKYRLPAIVAGGALISGILQAFGDASIYEFMKDFFGSAPIAMFVHRFIKYSVFSYHADQKALEEAMAKTEKGVEDIAKEAKLKIDLHNQDLQRLSKTVAELADKEVNLEKVLDHLLSARNGTKTLYDNIEAVQKIIAAKKEVE